jgi:hypothetical protein
VRDLLIMLDCHRDGSGQSTVVWREVVDVRESSTTSKKLGGGLFVRSLTIRWPAASGVASTR